MYHLDNSSGVAARPDIPAVQSAQTRWFTEGGNGVPPSYPGAHWFNIIQAELLGILTAAGIVPNKSQLNQLATAIKKIAENSPNLTGAPTAPTPEQAVNNTQIATTAFVHTAIAALVGSAPAELDTLEELAALLAENGDLRRTLLQKIGEKAPLAHKHTTADIEGLNDALDEAGKKGVPVGAVVAFPNAVANPVGFLKCDGTSFTQSLYPDLYRTLGNKNKLPDLTRSDVGMTAYFATDNIPSGWVAFDSIRTQVTQSAYPELYRHLVAKYGSIDAVPLAEDRFIRNAHGGLTVGQTQEDAIRNITGNITADDASENLISGAFSVVSNTPNAGNSGAGRLVKFDASKVVPTTDENRPKSLALKLCIKARNSIDDVQFWIKAFGSVENQGMMDAAQIAVALQEKANLNHTHHTADIIDFSDAANLFIQSQFTYQKIGNFDVRKYPDGTMIQTCIHRRGEASYNRNFHDITDAVTLTYPIAFIEAPTVSVAAHLSHGYGDTVASNDTSKRLWSGIAEANNGFIGIGHNTNNTQITYTYSNNDVFISEMSFHITAIGRWK